MLVPISYQIVKKISSKKLPKDSTLIEAFLERDYYLVIKIYIAFVLSKGIPGFKAVWKQIFYFYFRWIHLSSPKTFDYLFEKKEYLMGICKNCSAINSQIVRNHMSEVFLVLFQCNYNKITIDFVAPQKDKYSPEDYFKYFKYLYERDTKIYNCIFPILSFIDSEYVVENNLSFKIPKNKKGRMIWNVWEFLFQRARIQGKKEHECLNRLLERCLNVFLAFHQKKDIMSNYLLYFVILCIKLPLMACWTKGPNLVDPVIINKCGKVNFDYDTAEKQIESSANFTNRKQVRFFDIILNGPYSEPHSVADQHGENKDYDNTKTDEDHVSEEMTT